jgi:Flp pilus assembly protein TadG
MSRLMGLGRGRSTRCTEEAAVQPPRSLLRGEEGAETVEFALSASLLFFFIFGVIEWGLVFFMTNTANEAARDAARWASVRGTDCVTAYFTDGSCTNGTGTTAALITSHVQSVLPGTANMTATVNWCDTTGACSTSTSQQQGNTVKVKVSFVFAQVPFISLNKSLTVSGTSESVIW